MAPDEGGMIPKWASDLAVSVARVEGLAGQIPGLVTDVKELRAEAVPMSAHLELRRSVEDLKEQNIGAQSTWEEIVDQVPKLWEERTQRRGEMRVHRLWMGALSIASAALGVVEALRNLGVNISVGH